MMCYEEDWQLRVNLSGDGFSTHSSFGQMLSKS